MEKLVRCSICGKNKLEKDFPKKSNGGIKPHCLKCFVDIIKKSELSRRLIKGKVTIADITHWS